LRSNPDAQSADAAPRQSFAIGSDCLLNARFFFLFEAGIEPSVGSVGDRYDNALAENINGLHKTEVSHRRGPWRSFEAVEFAIFKWVDWFNNRRLLALIG
jgi:transposase InsO family protein